MAVKSNPLMLWLQNKRRELGEGSGLGQYRQADMAELLDVDRRSYGEWENGLKIPTATNMQRIQTAFPEIPQDIVDWVKTTYRPVRSFPSTPLTVWLTYNLKVSGLSKAEMARRVQINPITFGSLVSGKRRPSDAMFQQLLKAFPSMPESVQEWFAESKPERPLRIYKRKTDTPLSLWLQKKRLEFGITSVELSRQLGFGDSGIRKLEGGAFPSDEKLEKIGRFFGSLPKSVQVYVTRGRLQKRFKSAENTLSPFGYTIRVLRLERGLSQGDLNTAIGRGKQYIQRIERGERRLSEKGVRELAIFFGNEEVPDSWRELLKESDQEWRHRSEKPLNELKPLGRAIRVKRAERLLTIEELAQLTGQSAYWLSKVENGAAAASDELLEALAFELLNVSTVPDDWLRFRRVSRQIPQNNSGGLNSSLSPFGRYLRRLRWAHDLTQQKLGKYVGMSGDSIQEIEYGRRRVTEDELKQIGYIFGMEEIPEKVAELVNLSKQWYQRKGLKEEDLPEEGWKVRQARYDQGLSIKNLADIEGVSEWQAAESERGKRLSWKEKQAQDRAEREKLDMKWWGK